MDLHQNSMLQAAAGKAAMDFASGNALLNFNHRS